ncbi:hypothetical protein QFC21_003132 [Naganishia friedmannii]|uniref:Uncharacterized protein n=1 Tax=Naganishia friedmannii TaxID=89922 RepID=A0ACC2VRQ0_9TREE|nr:hypothetical protein QFC21_003132 [Naganishia friedmannii]
MSRLSEEEITTSVGAWGGGGGAAGKSGVAAGTEEQMGASTGDIIKKEATLRRERVAVLMMCSVIRDVVQLQGSLRDLLTQMDTLNTTNEKLRSEGELLQMYIENLQVASICPHTTSHRPLQV